MARYPQRSATRTGAGIGSVVFCAVILDWRMGSDVLALDRHRGRTSRTADTSPVVPVGRCRAHDDSHSHVAEERWSPASPDQRVAPVRNGRTITVIIPALNEEQAIGLVLEAIPSWVDRVMVADNGSTDDTAAVAVRHGAIVVTEPRRGYGSACLRAMAELHQTDIVVFLDGDFSDHPEEMDRLADPIIRGEVDLVVGSRVRGDCDPRALTLQARFGNWLACTLLRWFWNVEYTDLGPFRAIGYTSLMQLGMREADYGWTVEMQIKAAIRGLRTAEVPISYRPRIGRSKVSGTIRGVVGAGTKILYTILTSALHRKAPPSAMRGRHSHSYRDGLPGVNRRPDPSGGHPPANQRRGPGPSQ